MALGLIQQLIADGELVLYHDYRSGSFQDLSGQGNDGTPDGTTIWQNGALSFPAAASDVVVADAAELQLTEGALIFHADFIYQTNSQRMFYKRDAGGTNYDLYMGNADVRLYDGTNTRIWTVNITGTKLLAINMANGEAAEGFLNGLSSGSFNDVSALSANDAPLLIGNNHFAAQPLRNHLWAALIVNRKLTATEHAQMYSELSTQGGPS